MLEYWHRPEATADTITQDRWLRTGDVATVDEDGFVFIQDRIKDMIISGGENVYPAEIENVLMSHPEVVEAAVIGQPSEKWGESPFAIVVSKEPSLAEDIVLRHCDGKLARFKLPKGAAFIDVIPRNANGKVLNACCGSNSRACARIKLGYKKESILLLLALARVMAFSHSQ